MKSSSAPCLSCELSMHTLVMRRLSPGMLHSKAACSMCSHADDAAMMAREIFMFGGTEKMTSADVYTCDNMMLWVLGAGCRQL